jgi:hypothetical protein
MTVPKVWNGSSWTTVNQIVGPQGPQGPEGPGAAPNGAAGGALDGGYPNPGIGLFPGEAGGLLVVQRKWGYGTGYVAISNGQDFYAASGDMLLLQYTNFVGPVWWEVECCVGILQKVDGAYHLGYLYLNLDSADGDGQTQKLMGYQQHATVQTFNYRSVTNWWKLDTGRTWMCWASFGGTGSWQYHQTAPYLWMSGRVYAQ